MISGLPLKADSCSAGQEIPSFMKPGSSLPYSQNPATGLYPKTVEFSQQPHTLFL